MQAFHYKILEKLFFSQFAVYQSDADVVFLHGNRGGGKTDSILYSFLKNVGMGYGSEYKGIFYRREYKDLHEVKQRAYDIFKYDNLLPPGYAKYNKKDDVWIFRDGEKLFLHHGYKPEDYSKYHGWQLPFIGFDEKSLYPNLDFYHLIKSTNRAKHKHIPKKIIIATNPYGPCHNRLKMNFIDKAEDGVEYIVDRKKHVNISSLFSENKYIFEQKGYIDQLLSDPNTSRRKAWVKGDWDIVSGCIIDDIWKRRFHVPDRQYIPSNPKENGDLYCILDWGSARPFAVLFIYKLKNHVTFNDKHYKAGDSFIVSEIYGAKPGYENEGLHLTPEKVENKILERINWINWDFSKINFIADSQIFQDHGIPSIASHFKRINWESALKGKGSREHGLQILRELLLNSIPDKYNIRENPGLFITNNCNEWIRTVVSLPRSENNPEDAASVNVEDHLYDCTRYYLQQEKFEMKVFNM